MKAKGPLTRKQCPDLEEYEVDRIIERVATGEPLKRIANEMNLDYMGLTRDLNNFYFDRWKVALATREESMKEDVLTILHDAMSADVSDAFDNGVMKDVDEWPESLRRSLVSYSITDKGVNFKVIDKLRAAELGGKWIGLFKDKLEVQGEVTLSSLIKQSYQVKAKVEREKDEKRSDSNAEQRALAGAEEDGTDVDGD